MNIIRTSARVVFLLFKSKCVLRGVCENLSVCWRLGRAVPDVSWDGAMDEFTQTDKQ